VQFEDKPSEHTNLDDYFNYERDTEMDLTELWVVTRQKDTGHFTIDDLGGLVKANLATLLEHGYTTGLDVVGVFDDPAIANRHVDWLEEQLLKKNRR